MSELNAPKSKILIVEDDNFSKTILNMFLKNDYLTDCVENGVEALALLQNNLLPCLIISDLNTPEMNGLELIQYLKAIPNFQNIPIIILSGDDNPVQMQHCIDAGAAAFILKPFNPIKLGATIKHILAF